MVSNDRVKQWLDDQERYCPGKRKRERSDLDALCDDSHGSDERVQKKPLAAPSVHGDTERVQPETRRSNKRRAADVERSSAAPPSASSRLSSSKRSKLSTNEQREYMRVGIHEPSQAAIFFNSSEGKLATDKVPEDVLRLTRRFNLRTQFIPDELKLVLPQKYPGVQFVDSDFSCELTEGKELLELAEEFVERSRDLKARAEDESEWTRMIGDYLQRYERRNPEFKIWNVTAKGLQRTLYPALPECKIDLVICSNQLAAVFTPMSAFPSDISLSVFDKRHLTETIAFVGIEIKVTSGGSPDNQLAIWAAKTGKLYLEWVEYWKVKNNILSADERIKPIICISVVGATWYYHIMYHASDPKCKNAYIMLGEFVIADSNTILGIFMINKFLGLVREWVMEELWPWCVKLLGPASASTEPRREEFIGPERDVTTAPLPVISEIPKPTVERGGAPGKRSGREAVINQPTARQTRSKDAAAPLPESSVPKLNSQKISTLPSENTDTLQETVVVSTLPKSQVGAATKVGSTRPPETRTRTRKQGFTKPEQLN